MNTELMQIATNLPFPIKQTLRYAYGAIPISIRYGQIFKETYELLQESQWWSKEEIEKYQMQQLFKLLYHAYQNVPYYQRIFDERNLKPSDIRSLVDLKQLPYLTKELIYKNFNDLIARNYPKSKLSYVTTGGSTGIPLGLYHEKGVSDSKEWAFMFQQWKRIGFEIGNRCVVLRGNIVHSASMDKFWEYDPVNKNLILSTYHMTDEALPEYIQKIRKFKPDFIQAYPSAISILSRFMEKNNIKPFKTVKAIICASENIYPVQRENLERIFECRVYSFYGHSERVALAGECEYSSLYHIFPEYGIVELIGNNGETVITEDGIGEIVATGFNNYAFPLIRYKTMDLGVYTNKKCKCGREYPLLKRVEGRLQEIIVTKDKRLITLTALIFSQHFDAFARIKGLQLFQEEIGELQVHVIKTNEYSEADEHEILEKIKKASDNQIDVFFNYVDYIEKTKMGKHKFLIQKLSLNFGEYK